MELCGVDWPERPERFDVVYMLLSVSLNHRVRVVVPTSAETSMPSIHTLWPVATWFEREAWDLFGITFAIRGPLDKPDFKINPMSALVPGAFRRMFEYRSREIPRVE